MHRSDTCYLTYTSIILKKKKSSKTILVFKKLLQDAIKILFFAPLMNMNLLYTLVVGEFSTKMYETCTNRSNGVFRFSLHRLQLIAF